MAVTALGEVLCYLPAPSSPRSLFRRVHAALRPGGLFLFDVLVAARSKPLRYRTWRADEDWAVLVDVEETRDRVTREITTFRRKGRNFRRAREIHRQRVMRRESLTRLLREFGFSVTTTRRYGELELPPRRLAFIARKR